MTQDEIDKARIKRAYQLAGYPMTNLLRLEREGWMPPEPEKRFTQAGRYVKDCGFAIAQSDTEGDARRLVALLNSLHEAAQPRLWRDFDE
jgi:hypothetical protein